MTVDVGMLSAEAQGRLEVYVALLTKWNAAINLISRESLAQVWDRHVHDSAQLLSFIPSGARTWVDLGSGAGFPGMVIALLREDLSVTLIESDQRKCAFLSSVSRETGVQVTILNKRIEDTPPLGADIVSARALAPLSELCRYAARHLNPQGTALFLKGRQAKEEVAVARQTWDFTLRSLESKTDPQAVILELKDLRHV